MSSNIEYNLEHFSFRKYSPRQKSFQNSILSPQLSFHFIPLSNHFPFSLWSHALATSIHHPNLFFSSFCSKFKPLQDPYIELRAFIHDTNQASKEMTKDAHYRWHHEKSSQQTSENLTKDLADLTRGRNGHKPEHLMFFQLVFLRIKQVVNNLGSL